MKNCVQSAHRYFIKLAERGMIMMLEDYVDSSSEFYLEQLFLDIMIDEEPYENPWTEDFVLQLTALYSIFWKN